ncbi:hypothetical protein [Hydrogenophaga sp. PAMC20947]|uniref:hypothetical protein n=1 Tax=Hydrogenophaga sp. PAMC20947 TaxID=2565558 RepID=UPI00109DDCC7|nr:hypothetical protein [Hydrogenophaga sp. PAMC20947]QCB48349.1 hypothetical protein E5678_21375 [Hydrogenophaga sp. PAMC20947]
MNMSNETSPWLHALIWLMLAVAGLLLTAFVVVVNTATDRGELRRQHQNLSGSSLLPDEVNREGIALGATVMVPTELVARVEAQ